MKTSLFIIFTILIVLSACSKEDPCSECFKLRLECYDIEDVRTRSKCMDDLSSMQVCNQKPPKKDSYAEFVDDKSCFQYLK